MKGCGAIVRSSRYNSYFCCDDILQGISDVNKILANVNIGSGEKNLTALLFSTWNGDF